MKKNCIIVFFLLGLILFNFSKSIDYHIMNRLNLNKEKFNFGYYLTTNLFTFNIHPNIEKLKNNFGFIPIVIPQFGFSIGLINKFNFNDYIDFHFEPTIHVSKRKLNFRHVINYMNMKYMNNISTLNLVSSDIVYQINSTYFDLPFFVKFNGNLYYNHRPYFMSGFSCIFNLTPDNNFIENYDIDSIFKFKKINFTLQSEIGIDFFLKDIKIVPSFRQIIFLNNELINNKFNIENSNCFFDFSNDLKSISSQVWMFSIKVE